MNFEYTFDKYYTENRLKVKKYEETVREIALVVSRNMAKSLAEKFSRFHPLIEEIHLNVTILSLYMSDCKYTDWKHYKGQFLYQMEVDRYIELESSSVSKNVSFFNRKVHEAIFQNLKSLMNRKYSVYFRYNNNDRVATIYLPGKRPEDIDDSYKRKDHLVLRDYVTKMMIVNWWKKETYKPKGKGYQSCSESFHKSMRAGKN
jgi:hypothetical protein